MLKPILLIAIFMIPTLARAATCSAGYYLENDECKKCNPNYELFYCPGDDTKHRCPPNNADMASLSGGTVIEQKQHWAVGPTANAVTACKGSTSIRVKTGTYLAECSWNGINYWDACNGDFLWYKAEAGYYLDNYIGTSFEDWYHGVSECTNKPANAHYTAAGTPDKDGKSGNDCPWECDEGYYESNGICVLCEAGYYCTNGIKQDCGPGYFCTGGASKRACTEIIAPGDYEKVAINRTESNGNPQDEQHGVSANDCWCDFYYSDERRKYKYQSRCILGPQGAQLTLYSWCKTGYYPINFSHNTYYLDCAACTLKPDNAHFTDHGIPTILGNIEDNCPWECDNGFILTPQNTCVASCAAAQTLHANDDIALNIYAKQQTNPTLALSHDGAVCYINMAQGQKSGAINVQYNNIIYHLTN